jgi:hypothetical protein
MLCRRGNSRHVAAALTTAAALLAVASTPAAHAATAEVNGEAVIYDLDKTNPFAQDLLVEFKEGRYIFTERGSEPRVSLRPDAGCTKADDGKVLSCNGAGVTRMVISTENLDDVVTIGEGVTVPVAISTGQGGDQATGGPAADRFEGGIVQGLGNDTLEGLAGDDVFVAGPNADLMKGGEGNDTFDLSARALRQNVSLDGEANDGDPSDLASLDSASLSGGDNAQQIETLIGGSVKDTFTGDDTANALDGRNGADILEGKGGADTFIGGNGNDEILARSPVAGQTDADTQISCGGGQDRVTADPEDGPAIAADCEDVDCGSCELPPPGSPPNTPSPAPEIAAVDPPGGTNDQDEGTGAGGGGTPPGATEALPPQVEIVSAGVVPLKANGRIPVRIVCIYRADRCKGSLTLKASAAIKARVGGKLRTIKKGATIAEADLAPIRWGNSEPVQLKASAQFRSLLPRLGKPKAKVQAILVSQDTAGGDDAPEARATGDLTVGAKPARRR